MGLGGPEGSGVTDVFDSSDSFDEWFSLDCELRGLGPSALNPRPDLVWSSTLTSTLSQLYPLPYV